jgi:hypothetical protein
VAHGRHFLSPLDSLHFLLLVPLAPVDLAVSRSSFRSLVPFPTSRGRRFPLSVPTSFSIYHHQALPGLAEPIPLKRAGSRTKSSFAAKICRPVRQVAS